MASVLTGRGREPEATSGLMLDFNLAAEITALRNEPSWRSGRNAKTLVKYPDFRIVLTVLKRGAVVREHQAAGRISVQTIAGHLRMHVGEHLFDLPIDNMLVLDRSVGHKVEALEDSAFLLTIAWPKQ